MDFNAPKYVLFEFRMRKSCKGSRSYWDDHPKLSTLQPDHVKVVNILSTNVLVLTCSTLSLHIEKFSLSTILAYISSGLHVMCLMILVNN